MLLQAIRVIAVAAVRRTARGLHLSDFVRIRPQHTQKRFGGHGARPHFDIIGLLNNRAALRKESLELEDELLESRRVGFG